MYIQLRVASTVQAAVAVVAVEVEADTAAAVVEAAVV